MQCFLLLAFMLACLAGFDKQLCLLQQGSRRMLQTVKVPLQLCLHPQRDPKPRHLGEALCSVQREEPEGPGTSKNGLVKAKSFRRS